MAKAGYICSNGRDLREICATGAGAVFDLEARFIG
jgi:hypothetical protein